MIERLRLRGIRVEEVAEPHTLGVERYRLSEWKLAAPFEGRVALTAHVRSEAATETPEL